jgi:hypothetical protein
VLDGIAVEYTNIRAALVWTIATRSPRAAALVAAVGLAWHQRAFFHDARVLGDGALDAGRSDPRLWAAAAASLGSAVGRVSRFPIGTIRGRGDREGRG